jgi:hypothetical protein
MPVTNQQVATLRAMLSNDVELHRRLFAQLDRAEAKDGYTALVAGAFCEAVEQRFTGDNPAADVIGFVGDVRSRSERLAAEVDPVIAERIIRAVLGDGSVEDVSDTALVGTEVLLLVGLIADEQLDDVGLEAFLGRARKLADAFMG